MRPFTLLLLLFIAIPILEIAVLIQAGSLIGVLPTVSLVVLTAVVGVALLRVQGLQTLREVQAGLARGELPGVALLEGVMLLFAGALLLTPGFVTDTFGFLLLTPPLRRAIARAILARGVIVAHGGPGRHHDTPGGGRVIDGEAHRVDPPEGPSGTS